MNPINKSFSDDLTNILKYIETTLINEFPSKNIVSEYFIVGVLENKNCLAYAALEECLMTEIIKSIVDEYSYYLSQNPTPLNQFDIPRFSENFNEYIIQANVERVKHNHEKVNTLHMILSMLFIDGKIKEMFGKVGLTYDMFENYIMNNNLVEEVETKPKQLPSKVKSISSSQILKARKAQKTTLIDTYSQNLNDLASKGKIDKIVGREKEIGQMFNILGRRNKNNLILVGNGGVGKTAICRHLANLIVEKKAPVAYHKKKIVQMDISAMIAGANFRGMFEERLKGFLEEVKNDKNYVIFIDDIHNALGEKNQAGDVNVASMLNNVLIDGDIQVIGTTNFKDYKNTIENNSSLSRRFQKIVIEPSSINESITILNGCKEYYETYHNVKYTNEAIKSCVLLANRYISDRNLPDSAIDLLDESASRVVLKIKDTPEITNIKEELLRIKDEKRKILSNETYEGISDLNAKENTLKIKLSLLEKNNRYNTEQRTVYDNDVCELVSEKTSIPITKLSTTEKSSLKNINEILKSSIIGQDDAIDKICQVVKRNRVGLSNKNKPIVMFLGGPTGVGKTLIAKKLSKEVFGDEKYLVRLDMSEYAEKSSITKLIGSAPGYVGYDNGGQLTEIIKNKKYCVLLLDEIEKANQEIYNVFLQLFDEGCLTDNTGAKIDFKNVIILLTSNTGAKQVSDFGGGLGLVRNEQVNTKTIIQKELKKKFPPEFINRIDDIIYFNKLTDDNIKDIIRLELHNLDNRLIEIGFSLENEFYNETFVNFLFDKIKDQSEYGARPVLRIIQEFLENPITDLMLDMDDDEVNGDNVTILKTENFIK